MIIPFVRRSPLTGSINLRYIDTTWEEYDLRTAGVPIYDAMPRATADDLDFLVNGYLPEDRDRMFNRGKGRG